MSIVIHHGSNGSYKTSGVIQDYFIPAALEGRVVVTNIRGVDYDKTFDILGDLVTPGFDVIYVDTDNLEGRQKLATFWHWVPLGALLLFDEAGVNFPKRWREKDLERLVLPNFEELGRPRDWVEAWEMHRHFNWDIVLSCPNIKSVRQDIRDTSEGAYKHRNNALVGMKGSYNEGFHSAQDNGSSVSQFITVKKKKIHERTFKLYQSTKTGQHQDTKASTSLLDNITLMVALVVSLSAFAYSAYGWIYHSPFEKASVEPVELVEKNQPVSNEKDIIKAVYVPSSDNTRVNVNKSYDLNPYKDYTFSILGFIKNSDKFLYLLQAKYKDRQYKINSKELEMVGYSFIPLSSCSATLVFKTYRENITCQGSNNPKPKGIPRGVGA